MKELHYQIVLCSSSSRLVAGQRWSVSCQQKEILILCFGSTTHPFSCCVKWRKKTFPKYSFTGCARQDDLSGSNQDISWSKLVPKILIFRQRLQIKIVSVMCWALRVGGVNSEIQRCHAQQCEVFDTIVRRTIQELVMRRGFTSKLRVRSS